MTSRLRRGLGSASAALLLGLTLVACGGDDGDSDDKASSDNGSSSEESSDTGSDDASESGSDDDSDDAGSGDGPSEQDLEAALLSADQVPAGFQATGDENESDEEDDEDNPFAGTCLADVGEFDDKVGDPAVEAKTEYEQSNVELPGSIEVGISYYSTDVEDEFADFVDELGSCPRVLSTVDDVTFDLDVTTEEFAALDADDTAKVTMAGTISSQGQSFPLTATVIAILKDNYVSTVSTFEFQTETLSAQADIWANLQYSNVYELR
ncbi:hypothetical protein ACFQ0K_12060 [Nocardioides caeni]|uniref:Lipoprotein n=1 Tax=Nocardioides caeni TaxID=574700 RepID=A0A4V4HLD1_9ACTN|nr:hypothetical protein [Nocardioides caeni]THV17826.1 hypothetical protein E9934_05010 [Nocardioides caeni]